MNIFPFQSNFIDIFLPQQLFKLMVAIGNKLVIPHEKKSYIHKFLIEVNPPIDHESIKNDKNYTSEGLESANG